MENIVTLKKLNQIATKVLRLAHETDKDTATVIALKGELGSGKTTLTQEIAKILKVKESVISPTFVIIKKYKVEDKFFRHLIHIDAYRLNNSEELRKLGWQEIFENKTNLIIIEWPEQVPECIPKNACKIVLTHKKENIRTIKL
jgi:tRNA threonylcarbamoyladenosine biosynthesis protein TsaE